MLGGWLATISLVSYFYYNLLTVVYYTPLFHYRAYILAQTPHFTPQMREIPTEGLFPGPSPSPLAIERIQKLYNINPHPDSPNFGYGSMEMCEIRPLYLRHMENGFTADFWQGVAEGNVTKDWYRRLCWEWKTEYWEQSHDYLCFAAELQLIQAGIL